MRFQKFQHHLINPRPLRFHYIKYEGRRAFALFMHNAERRIIAISDHLDSDLTFKDRIGVIQHCVHRMRGIPVACELENGAPRPDLAPAFRYWTTRSAAPFQGHGPPGSEVCGGTPGFQGSQGYDIARWITFEAGEVCISSLHCLLPIGRTPDALLQCPDAALDLATNEIDTERHAESWVGSGFKLPGEPMGIGGVSGIANYGLNPALPIDADQRHALLGEPRENVKEIVPEPSNKMMRDGSDRSPLKKRNVSLACG